MALDTFAAAHSRTRLIPGNCQVPKQPHTMHVVLGATAGMYPAVVNENLKNGRYQRIGNS